MKRNLTLAAALLFLSVAISTSAQTRPTTPAPTTPRPAATPAPAAPGPVNVPPAKIALVDTGMFRDERAGIKRYVAAVKSVQASFQARTTELVNMQNRIKVLAEEINKLNSASVVSPDTIRAKQSEGESLQRDLKYKKEQLDSDIEKKFGEVVGPISTDIGKALDAFAAQHGVTMVLDLSKLFPTIITWNGATDITVPFIADYNSKNP